MDSVRRCHRHRDWCCGGLLLDTATARRKVAAVERELEERRTLTEKETTEILEISRQEAQQIRLEAEKTIERRYQDLARAEERVDRRSENLDKQVKKMEHREAVLNKRQSRLDKRQNRLETIEQE
ncbi:MAG: hypothetical protein KC445_14335, partial [Anaerolineales bacterium]|nr:hypothetical protein [Anaerolineales bacterium]